MTTKIMNPFLILFVGLLFNRQQLIAQSVDTTIPGQVSLYMDNLISSFNKGDTLSIENFIRESHHAKVLEQVPINQLVYRLSSVYYQYGPLEAVVYKRLSKTTAIVWTRGKISRAWVGIQLFFTENPPHKITAIGIDRGQSPPGEELLENAVSYADFRNKLSRHLKTISETAFFSGSVAVSKNGKSLFNSTVGFMDKENKILNSNKTHFLIASTSKMFVAVAIMQLKEKGLLSTSDVISKFIPEYPKTLADSVTIHRLLTHTSGIELDEVPEFNKGAASAKSIKDLIDLQIEYIPKVPELENYRLPGEFNYTNEGYALLARIVEVISGMNYWDYVEKNIFRPAGMKNTLPLHKATGKIAKGYTNRNPSNGKYISAIPVERVLTGESIAHPAGDIVSTSDDLLLFAKSISRGKLISQASFKEMATGYINEAEEISYGYGVRIQSTIAGICIGHAGDKLGFNCRLDIYPNSGVAVAVLANQDQTAKNMADYIREILPRK